MGALVRKRETYDGSPGMPHLLEEIILPVVRDPGGRHPHGGERWVTRVGRDVGW